MDKKLQGLYIVLIFGAIVGFIIWFYNFKNDINPIYAVLILFLIKVLYINPKFVKGYASLLKVKPKFHWYIPVISEYAIFYPFYSMASLISFGVMLILGGLSYLVGYTSFDLSFIVGDLAIDSAFTNLIWMFILSAFVYNLFVSLGYLQVDRYIKAVYYEKFSSFKVASRNVASYYSIFTYLIPIVRAVAMNNAVIRINKLLSRNKSDYLREDV